jgi:hypothetical protein
LCLFMGHIAVMRTLPSERPRHQAVSGEFPIAQRDTIFRVGRNKKLVRQLFPIRCSGRFFVNVGLL